MPKQIELTLQLEIQKVSCPGVWLCQDGRVSLTVYTLGTSYQTCLLPPMFPLLYKDIFYFRKRFNQSCALNNLCCMMKDESLYCELVQWCDDCSAGDCVILAQYIGALSDVLFPPTMCSIDGVDLLMRRSKAFPGILSPKIEVATKIRIDEVWNKYPNGAINPSCDCLPEEKIRSKPVCHTAPYHRFKCGSSHRPRSASRSRSRMQSEASKSCCNLAPKEPVVTCDCPSPEREENVRSACGRRLRTCPEYNVYNVKENGAAWVNNHLSYHSPETEENIRSACGRRQRLCPDYNVYNVKMNGAALFNNVCQSDDDEPRNYETDQFMTPNEDLLKKRMVQSQFIEEKVKTPKRTTVTYPKVYPCICEICKRYHELFHAAAK